MPSFENVRSKTKQHKLSKLIEQSDSEESEHELSHYLNDRVKLMKEVLKTIKPKKIKAMAPDFIESLDVAEINSMLLEELLGISNKRLQYIFHGQNLDEDNSSTEEEEKPIDIISLDDISDDDFVIDVDAVEKTAKSSKRIKKERRKTIKEEGETKKNQNENPDDITSNRNLMSVLELLELQARARAIKSQLLLESSAIQQLQPTTKLERSDESDNGDEVIIQSPQHDEIVITSSESERDFEINRKKNSIMEESNELTREVTEKRVTKKIEGKKGKTEQNKDNNISDFKHYLEKPSSSNIKYRSLPVLTIKAKYNVDSSQEDSDDGGANHEKIQISRNTHLNVPIPSNDADKSNVTEIEFSCETLHCGVDASLGTPKPYCIDSKKHDDTDEIVINVDEDEINGIINSCSSLPEC